MSQSGVLAVHVFARSVKLPEKAGVFIPVEDSTDVLAAIGRRLCIVDRETGKWENKPLY